MQINTYENEIVTAEVTKSYTDFQTAATSNTIDILTLNPGDTVIGIQAILGDTFGGIEECECLLSMNKSLITGKRITNNKTPLGDVDIYRDLASDPLLIVPSVWTTGGDMIIGREFMCGGLGTQSAALATGGFSGSNLPIVSTEEYNGTAWADASASLNTGRWAMAGCGTQSAGLVSGGNDGTGSSDSLDDCEEYNGASWTTGGTFAQQRHYNCSCGTQTAGLLVSGWHSGTVYPTTDEYNGATWSSSASLVQTRYLGACFGIQSAAAFAGGYSATTSLLYNTTELYNGTTWSITGNCIIARDANMGGGTQSNGIISSGYIRPQGGTSALETTNETEFFTDDTWSMGTRSNIGRAMVEGCGTQSAALLFGGLSYPSYTPYLSTEEHTTSGYSNTIDLQATIESVGLSSWSYGSEIPIPGWGAKGCGSLNAGMINCSYSYILPGNYDKSTAEYNGSSWTITSDLSQKRVQHLTVGTQSAAFSTGGYTSTTTVNTEEYNGASWGAGGDLNQSRQSFSGAGTLSAGLASAGYSNNPSATYTKSSEEYNGTAWTSGNDLNTDRYSHGGGGTQTNAFVNGGKNQTGGGYAVATTEEYNGTIWSTAIESNAAVRGECATFGAFDDAVRCGGTKEIGDSGSGGLASLCEKYNGNTWSYTADLIQGVVFGAGFSNNGYEGAVCGGYKSNDYDVGSMQIYLDGSGGDLTDLSSGSLTFKIKYINYSGEEVSI